VTEAASGAIANACRRSDCPAIRRALGAWYRRHRRRLPWREAGDPYRIWLSEVMLQQTQVKTALPYYERFTTAFPDVARLAAADPQQVLKLWEGLGYYRRAHHLMAAARAIVRDWDGRLPERREAFRALPGVGDYIANAVMSIAFGQPYAVVDGNVKRVLARLFLVDAPVNRPAAHARFQSLADVLLNTGDPSEHNQALMELGALVCTPRGPACPTCPLADHCRARRDGVVARYPARAPKAAVPEHAMVAAMIFKRGKLLIVQRPDEGFLGGLWEFPGGRRQAGEAAAAACRRLIREQTGLTVAVDAAAARVKHAYTHFKIVLDVLTCRWQAGRVRLEGPAAFRWVRRRELTRFPLPGAVKKALDRLSEEG
jgi:A/G-specific adenine glycosylase